MTETARPDPEPHDEDLGEDLREEVERGVGDGRDTPDERDEPAFDAGSQGMDAPPPG